MEDKTKKDVAQVTESYEAEIREGEKSRSSSSKADQETAINAMWLRNRSIIDHNPIQLLSSSLKRQLHNSIH